MRVTGFNLEEATAAEMCQRGGERTSEGVLCKTKDLDSDYKSEEWTHIIWTDEQMCDGTTNCENGMDEPEELCQQEVVVTGSEGRDGVYEYRNGGYKSEIGKNIIFKKDNVWALCHRD